MRPQKLRKTIDIVTSPIQEFAKLEASSGIVLIIAAAMAMFFANASFTATHYLNFINMPFSITIGGFTLDKTLLLLVNDGLMAIFFYLVGLEIKTEVLAGELSTPKKASFSIFAAIGGMAIPALIYLGMNMSGVASEGWGIPMATDIAFALGVLALVGKRAPVALKIFLLALAIVDDLGAIVIIALFYTSEIAGNYLGFAGLGLFLLFLLNYAGFRNIVIGLMIGFAVWFCFLKSGIHATLAGVLLAFLTPARALKKDHSIDKKGPLILDDYIHSLHPWVAFLIMPIFAFFNAGVPILGVDMSEIMMSPVTLGIIFGLVVGKPLGIFLFTFIPVKMGWTRLPKDVTWPQVVSIGFMAGIGFTMSLFINSLAFSDVEMATQAKMGILLASIIAAIFGSAMLGISVKAAKK